MDTRHITPLFIEDKKIDGKKPNFMMSDCARNFYDEINKEFVTLNSPRVKHTQHIRLAGENHKNKMEHFNGEVRDREKEGESVKSVNTPALIGYRINHNCLRPHLVIKMSARAKACRRKIEEENKWITLIQNGKKS